jgi:protein-tyrosine-phosphatase
MAEGILRAKIVKLGRNDFYVTSSGIHARENQSATDHAVEICKENGIDITHHLSRPLNPKELHAADLVLAMEPVQKDFMLLFFPGLQDKVGLLGAWPEAENRKSIIPDPMGGDEKEYRKTFELINSHIERIIPYLLDFLP